MMRLKEIAGRGATVLCLVLAATAANAQTVIVSVPGNALGSFGNPACCSFPLVTALTVSGPGTITVSYISGTVTDSGGINTGPNGVVWNVTGNQFPLQEASGISGGPVDNLDALIGVFVPRLRVLASGFSPVDGTKGTPSAPKVGILPTGLVFIGTGRTIVAEEAGTLFLGINDDNAASNGGAFLVSVTFVPSS